MRDLSNHVVLSLTIGLSQQEAIQTRRQIRRGQSQCEKRQGDQQEENDEERTPRRKAICVHLTNAVSLVQ